MSLSPGVRLGPYEILSAIGAGGMGEVYRARDTQLNRDVAIKILPDAFALDPDRVSRFKREAQVLASLNHPHIASIYGFEEATGVHALILELVDGPTLADRIAQGPAPLDEAIPIARQIADALEAAHEQGVIHRDLKPANIKLKADGTVKVLDFGLAKALGPVESSGPAQAGHDDLTQSPTMTSPAATRVGVILGTAAYMSPEQARGKTVDKRSDIWAFGCVLYETLTGKPAFDGEDVSLTLSKILQREPDWSALPQTVPAAVRQLLIRCLEKDPKRRLRDIGDARVEIETALATPSTSVANRTTPRSLKLRAAAAWGLSGLLVGAVTVGLAGWLVIVPAEAPRRVARFAIIPESETVSSVYQDIAISSDGTRIVYVVESAQAAELRVREIDQLEGRTIAGVRFGIGPFLSPAGDQVGFQPAGELRLRKVAIGGGPSTVICSFDGEPAGASWGPDDTIVFALVGGKPGLLRVSASGGTPEFLARPDPKKNQREFRHPTILPGGQSVLFTIVPLQGGIDGAQIAVRSLVTGDQKILIEGGTDAAYAQTGHLVYARNGGLAAAPFNLATLEVTGRPVAIQNNVVTTGTGDASYAFSADGTLVYLPGTSNPSRRLAWVSGDGKKIDPIPSVALSYARYPRLSPNGRRLAITVGASFAGDVWIYDLDSERQPIPLTFEGHDLLPIWSPDGKTIVFQSDKRGPRNLFSLPADGSVLRDEPLLTGERWLIPLDWSPDGRALLFEQLDPETRADLWILPLGGDRKPRPWLQTRFGEGEGRFSPDGRWVAYVSDQTGQNEVWVRSYPGPSAPIGISSDGGHEPVWARDGRELYYQSGTRLMAVRVLHASSTFRFEPARTLVDGGFIPSVAGTPRTYDAAPDGRLLMIQPVGGEARVPQFVLVQNWFEELKQRVASR